MTIEAARPAPDQWEQDLTELLGLNEAGSVSGAAHHNRTIIVAVVLTAFALTALCLLEVRQLSVAKMAAPASIIRVITERSVPKPTVITTEPAPPTARPGNDGNNAATGVIDRPGAGTGSDDHKVSALPVALASRPASVTRDHDSALEPRLLGDQTNAVPAGRASVGREATLSDTFNLPKRTDREARIPTVSSVHEVRGPDSDDALADDRGRPLPIRRDKPLPHDEGRGGQQPLPPSQRSRVRDRSLPNKKTEAIDAIRLLRRQ